MENSITKCPFCNTILDENSLLYKGYYVCSSCGSVVNASQNAEVIRRFSNFIRNLDFYRASSLRNEMLDNVSFDVNESQLFTFYSSILDLFLTRDPNKFIKFLNDTSTTDIGVVIEVLSFLCSLSTHIEKLGTYILEYVNLQEKYLAHLENKECDRALIETKKRYFKHILNKSAFIADSYKTKKMDLDEIIELVSTKDPSNIACLYVIFDSVEKGTYTKEEINNYLLTCDYSLELYFEKTKKKLSENYKKYYKRATVLRKKLNLPITNQYKWQKRLNDRFINRLTYWMFLVIVVVVVVGAYRLILH